ncbi:RIMS-binding protein 2-like [Tropilaelaps mercedesae]|uniref:RIMS-binding protein 2-like n=1 Tax=Tropilaelaps mercedesae TaxID=418985 RepID=A0A1V9X7T8_9ACAR|nr:RIMS-binding protein 2-like [Tropilaelaps mercedesae]
MQNPACRETDDEKSNMILLMIMPMRRNRLVKQAPVTHAKSYVLPFAAYQFRRLAETPQLQPTAGQVPAGSAPHTVSSQELEGLMKKLEQDNKVLAELDRKRLEREALQTQQQQLQQQPCTCGQADTTQPGSSAPLCCQNAGQATTVTLVTPGTCPHVQLIQPGTSGTTGLTCCAAHGKAVALPVAPAGASTVCTAISGLPSTTLGPRCMSAGVNCAPGAVATPAGMLRTHTPLGLQNKLMQHANTYQHAAATPDTVITSYSAMSQKDFYDDLGVDSVDYVDIPGRGRCRVYLARYSYDPLKQSPNENPEAELALSAGEYVLIFGEIDEDGFYNGELLDGQRGLVPSNFIEKLTGEDLFQFQTTVLYCYRDSDESSVAGTAYMTPDEGQYVVDPPVRIAPEDYHRMNDYIDMEEDDEPGGDEESFTEMDGALPHYPSGRPKPQFVVPAPQRLVLERQLNKSILIGWLPPDVVLGSLESYQVYVDGELRAVIRAGERTRALVESVDSSIPHRVSVRSVLVSGHHSRDAACTVVIGKNIPLAPSFVKAASITSTSALIRWIPSNSNFQHVVAVNNVDLKLVKPGVYRYSITGLSPNTVYRVSVRARPGKLLVQNTKKSSLVCAVEFRTLAKGIPDPPVDIRVEPGPQDGTILVTWLPVHQNNNPEQPGLPVSGYAVFASGRMVTQIDSPSGDHALLSLTHLLNSRTITVRTKADTLLSADSLPCHIPEYVLKGKRLPPRSLGGCRPRRSPAAARGSASFETAGEDTRPAPIVERGASLDSDLESETEIAALLCQVSLKELGQVIEASQRSHDTDEQMLRMDESYSESDVVDEYGRRVNGTGPTSAGLGGRRFIGPQGRLQRSTGYGASPPQVAVRLGPHGPKRNSAGQLVLEPEECLSDKEIYPQVTNPALSASASGAVPAIEVTKDRSVVDSYSEEEFDKHNELRRPISPGHRRGIGLRGRAMGMPMGGMGGPMGHGGPMGGGQGHQRSRWFMALFDYDPLSMSPNPDAAHEELPFKEGQLIRVYGEKDTDGFYRGELNGRMGLVPCNMVSEVQGPHPGGHAGQGPPHLQQLSQAHNRGPQGGQGRRKMLALYDYDPSLSPNVDAEMELSFRTGDVLHVLGEMDEDGFYMAELNGVRGLVPSNFLTEAPPNYPDQKGGMGPPPMRGPPRGGSGGHGGPPHHAQHPSSGHPDHDMHGRGPNTRHDADPYYDSRRGPARGQSDYQTSGGPLPPRHNPGGPTQGSVSQGPSGQGGQGGQGYGYNTNNSGPVGHRDPQGYRDPRDPSAQGQRPPHGRFPWCTTSHTRRTGKYGFGNGPSGRASPSAATAMVNASPDQYASARLPHQLQSDTMSERRCRSQEVAHPAKTPQAPNSSPQEASMIPEKKSQNTTDRLATATIKRLGGRHNGSVDSVRLIMMSALALSPMTEALGASLEGTETTRSCTG